MNSQKKIYNHSTHRRVFNKTQLSSSKKKTHEKVHLKNNFFSHNDKFATIDSNQKNATQGSFYPRNKPRSSSHSRLFLGIKSKEESKSYYKKKEKNNSFVIPKQKDAGFEKIDKQGNKKHLITNILDSLIQQKGPNLKIKKSYFQDSKQNYQEEKKEQWKEKIMKKNQLSSRARKIEHILQFKYDSRRENMKKSQSIIKKLVEDYTQTEQLVIRTQMSEKEKAFKKKTQQKSVYKQRNAEELAGFLKIKEEAQNSKKQYTTINDKTKQNEIFSKEQAITKQIPNDGLRQRRKLVGNQSHNVKKKNIHAQLDQLGDLEQITLVDKKKQNHLKTQINQNTFLSLGNNKSAKKVKTESNQKKDQYLKPDQVMLDEIDAVNPSIQLKKQKEQNSQSEKNQSKGSSDFFEELENIKLNPISNLNQKMLSKPHDQKQKAKEQFEKAVQIINKITKIGQVAPVCSLELKKVKAKWYEPAILLYKQTYLFFIRYRSTYRQALKHGIIPETEYDQNEEDINKIKENIVKLLVNGKKKGRIRQEYWKLIDPECNQDLEKYIVQQVLKYCNQVLESSQNENNAVLMSCIRMINSILILANFKGKKYKMIDESPSPALNRASIKQNLSLIKKRDFI